MVSLQNMGEHRSPHTQEAAASPPTAEKRRHGQLLHGIFFGVGRDNHLPTTTVGIYLAGRLRTF